jgi:hypothetical protein
MKAPDLACAYVTLDRYLFFQLQNTGTFERSCEEVRNRLKINEGLPDLDKLCAAGAESSELLWILRGCEGLPGFSSTSDVFGWSAPELKKGLARIEEAASFIEKVAHYPFGLLAAHTSNLTSGLQKSLRSYLELARAAQSDFGHGSFWFLNIAKARLVIHVRHRTKGNLHDKAISGLIAAITRSDYDEHDQRQWRRKYPGLIGKDSSLDPYTLVSHRKREQKRQFWQDIAAQEPEFFKVFENCLADTAALNRSRRRRN